MRKLVARAQRLLNQVRDSNNAIALQASKLDYYPIQKTLVSKQSVGLFKNELQTSLHEHVLKRAHS